ncbi:phosphatidylinositol glycan [Anaeramoeba flamelloides]|uniref:GPI ethanolamine phosphate transferase 1 n=1 Tax=Anaeramoeba flamelloides TaxID=1746091 RepID=A0ABQ8YLL1_9EUKA|nr:phosphatidylinositol glycan [Anaeramoeba flamelloides]
MKSLDLTNKKSLLITVIIFTNLLTLFVALLIKYDSPYVEIDEVTKPQYYYTNKTKEQLNVPPVQLSKRFVLFILDGCRSDAFFIFPNDYFKEKLDQGQFGISITDVPTETRTCHMNLFSGRPEDPSSIFFKFSQTPHEYNSIWSNLDYSLLVGPKMAIVGYNNFEGKKINTEQALRRSGSFRKRLRFSSELFTDEIPPVNTDISALQKMNLPKTGYYINFEGTDSGGHFYDEYGFKYFRLLTVAAEEIKRIEDLFNNNYKDGLTTFIISADHGMSKRGTHGGESKYELNTPYIIWGNGISKPAYLKDGEERAKPKYDFDNFNDWLLPKNKKRIDIYQNSLPSLLSCILGVGLPTNSIGRINENILSDNEHFKVSSLLANLKQLYTLFNSLLTKHNKQCIIGENSIPNTLKEEEVKKEINAIIHLIRNKEFLTAKERIHNLLDLVEYGLGLITSFGKVPSKILVLCSYAIFCWFSIQFSIFLKQKIIYQKNLINTQNYKLDSGDDDFNNSLDKFEEKEILNKKKKKKTLNFFNNTKKLYRIYIGNSTIRTNNNKNLFQNIDQIINLKFKVIFFATNLLIITFILIPIEYDFQINWILFGGAFIIFVSISLYFETFSILNKKQLNKLKQSLNRKIFIYQLILIFLSTLISYNSSKKILEQKEISRNTIYMSWVIIFGSILPLFSSYKYQINRLNTVFLSFTPFFILITLNKEIIHFGLLYVLLLSLYKIVKLLPNYNNIEWIVSNLTLYLFFLTYFGSGNVISISSFCYKCVNKVLSEEDYLIMTILIVIKILLPMIFICIFLQFVLKKIKLQSNLLIFMIWNSQIYIGSFVLLLLQNKHIGSWKNNLRSIAPFLIFNGMGILGIILLSLSKLFILKRKVKNNNKII